MKHHEFHAVEADPEGAKLLAAATATRPRTRFNWTPTVAGNSRRSWWPEMKHHEFHAIEADPEGVKLLAAAVTLLRIKKQNQCLIQCLKDARAALETPDDLSKTDLRHLIEDINTLLKDVDAKDNGETTEGS
jgi:hypothetical protein